MYTTLLYAHSYIRWILLAFLLIAIFRAYTGLRKKRIFSRQDNAFRHWTATVSHIQLMIGIILYTRSPVAKYFWNHPPDAPLPSDAVFFGLIHMILMLIAIVVITIGSALAKRKEGDTAKFKTTFIWFSAALLLILIAVPWPFSPLSNRPLLR